MFGGHVMAQFEALGMLMKTKKAGFVHYRGTSEEALNGRKVLSLPNQMVENSVYTACGCTEHMETRLSM